MKCICAGTCHNTDLRSRRPARVGISARRDHAKLVHRVERRSQHAGKREALHLIIVVHAVQGHVALIGSRACHCTRPAVQVLVDAVSEVEHAGLQAQQIRYVASPRWAAAAPPCCPAHRQASHRWCLARATSPPRSPPSPFRQCSASHPGSPAVPPEAACRGAAQRIPQPRPSACSSPARAAERGIRRSLPPFAPGACRVRGRPASRAPGESPRRSCPQRRHAAKSSHSVTTQAAQSTQGRLQEEADHRGDGGAGRCSRRCSWDY